MVDRRQNEVIRREHGETGPNYDTLLKRVRIEFDPEATVSTLHQKIVDTAIEIMGSQYATMQILYPDPGRCGKLLLVASHGFTAEAEKYWEWVYHYSSSSCAEVLKTRRRVIIHDHRTADFMKDSPTLSVFIEAGILSAQSTPIYSRTGVLLGMISTHWNTPYTPQQYQLDLIDILAKHAADLLELTASR
ncbi:MAG: GAF domain-containing protein [Daejeonella sp.]|uniref:GAF domain-containing protein n=1 Tax=Daejeonella sp. TaxID=2805397 RepID=UPI003C745CD9